VEPGVSGRKVEQPAELAPPRLHQRRLPLGGLLDLAPADAGLHLIGWLPPGVDDRAAAAAAHAAGVDTLSVSAHRADPPAMEAAPAIRGGLLLGYAPVRPPRIRAATRALARALAPLA
jgi:GntR family transcriptional regulator/MocR family aminotransferase